MKLRVNEGWSPGISYGGKVHAPGETFEASDSDAGQFLANGSATEVKAKTAGSTRRKASGGTRGR